MIQVESLTKYYGDFLAVDRISFEISRGQIVGLLGPNGAGKTSTLRILTGYLAPSSGAVTVGGFSIGADPIKVKRMMGYLPESAPLYHGMLVYDYLLFVAGMRGITRDKALSRIRLLAKMCGLHEIMNRTIGELSKGLKQRVGLAHAMMGDPEILVLDEPTSGLDPNQIIEIREIIKRIGKEKTVVLSTHILSEAEATCDRVVIINKGKIVANDSADALKRSAGGQCYINVSLLNSDYESAEGLLGSVQGVLGVERLPETEGVSLRLICNSSPDQRGTIYQKIKATDWTLVKFQRETRSLESVFRELTKEDST